MYQSQVSILLSFKATLSRCSTFMRLTGDPLARCVLSQNPLSEFSLRMLSQNSLSYPCNPTPHARPPPPIHHRHLLLQILTNMERNGVSVDVTEHMPRAEVKALADRNACQLTFRRWAAEYCEEAWFINVGSSAQIQTLLFGGAAKRRGRETLPMQRSFKLDRGEWEDLERARTGDADESDFAFCVGGRTLLEEEAAREAAADGGVVAGPLTGLTTPAQLNKLKVADIRAELSTRGLDATGVKATLVARLAEALAEALGPAEPPAAAAAAAAARPRIGAVREPKAKKSVDFELKTMKLEHTQVTAAGWPATDGASLRELAGAPSQDPPTFGSAYESFGGGAVGERACKVRVSPTHSFSHMCPFPPISHVHDSFCVCARRSRRSTRAQRSIRCSPTSSCRCRRWPMRTRASTARSISTRRRGASLHARPTCRTSQRLRRTSTRSVQRSARSQGSFSSWRITASSNSASSLISPAASR